jgi:hypothetical protein
MWDSTKLYLKANDPNQRLGIPHLAKNERDVGHPSVHLQFKIPKPVPEPSLPHE